MPIEGTETVRTQSGDVERFHVTCDVCGEEAEGTADELTGWSWTHLSMNGETWTVALCKRDGDHAGEMWRILDSIRRKHDG